MAPWIIPAIMAVIALGKANNDQKNVTKKANLAAETEKYSPWTGLHGQMPDAAPDKLSSVAQAALSGFAVSQGINSAEKVDALTQAQADYLERAGGGIPQSQVMKALEAKPEMMVVPSTTPAMPNLARYQQTTNSPWGYV